MAEKEEKKCPPAGSPAWMATFADLMSLLLVLFVLLLTFSEMDVQKYKEIAQSLKSGFGTAQQTRTQSIINIDGQPQHEINRNRNPDAVSIPLEITEIDPESTPEEQADIVEHELARIIAEEASEQGVEVEKDGNEVKIRFPSEIAFGSGSATVNREFADLLDKLTGVIAKATGEVFVGGHTDDVPLGGGGQYRSNWELSAARATSVVHYFLTSSDIAPERMGVEGYGESRPLVPNDSPENRAKNRRVEITLVLGEGQRAEENQVQDQLDAIFGPREPSLLEEN